MDWVNFNVEIDLLCFRGMSSARRAPPPPPSRVPARASPPPPPAPVHAQPSAVGAAQPRQPGLLANMASTAAGVAVGSAVVGSCMQFIVLRQSHHQNGDHAA